MQMGYNKLSLSGNMKKKNQISNIKFLNVRIKISKDFLKMLMLHSMHFKIPRGGTGEA
jgi:hypothetical protein